MCLWSGFPAWGAVAGRARTLWAMRAVSQRKGRAKFEGSLKLEAANDAEHSTGSGGPSAELMQFAGPSTTQA